MTWLHLVAGVVPGLSQLFRRRWRWALALGGLAALSVGFVASAAWTDAWLFDPRALDRVALGAAAFTVASCVSIAEAFALSNASLRSRVAVASVVVPFVAAVGASSWLAASQSAALDAVSARVSSGPVAVPATPAPTGPDRAEPPTTPSARPPATGSTSSSSPPSSSPPPSSSSSSTTASPPPERWNILLLGGDAGPGRYSLRTDAMMLVSIEPVSGSVATISIPRNLERVPLPPGPLADRFGDTFPDLLNAVYTKVSAAPGVFAGVSDDPGADAITTVVANLLGVRVDDWVLVDMSGFVDIVDALGGVDVVLSQQVVLPGNPPGAKYQVPPSIGPGPVHLDGTLALGYARSRSQDSDYKRMGRQRCLLEAAFEQHSTSGLALAFPELRDAVVASMRTTLEPASLERLVRLAPEVRRSTRALLLVPPLVKPSRPDVSAIRALTAAFLATPGAPVEVPPVSAPSTTGSVPPDPAAGGTAGVTVPESPPAAPPPSSPLPCEL